MWWANLALRVLLAGVFLLAAVSKARSREAFDAFGVAVARLGRVPARLVPAAAVGVIAVEIATGVALLIPATEAGALIVGVVVLAAFTAALARGRRTHPGLSCACFGSSTAPVGAAQLIRNGLLIALSCAALIAGLTADPAQRHTAPALAVAVFGGAVSALLIAYWDDLAAVLS